MGPKWVEVRDEFRYRWPMPSRRAKDTHSYLTVLSMFVAGCVTPSPILSGDIGSNAQTKSSQASTSKGIGTEIEATALPTFRTLDKHLQSSTSEDKKLRVTCAGETWGEGHLATPYERWYVKVEITAMARPDLEHIKLQITSTRDAQPSNQDIELTADHFSYQFDAQPYPLRADECAELRTRKGMDRIGRWRVAAAARCAYRRND